jgi:hypothetical protein
MPAVRVMQVCALPKGFDYFGALREFSLCFWLLI